MCSRTKRKHGERVPQRDGCGCVQVAGDIAQADPNLRPSVRDAQTHAIMSSAEHENSLCPVPVESDAPYSIITPTIRTTQ
jgi:hypothetical protein